MPFSFDNKFQAFCLWFMLCFPRWSPPSPLGDGKRQEILVSEPEVWDCVEKAEIRWDVNLIDDSAPKTSLVVCISISYQDDSAEYACFISHILSICNWRGGTLLSDKLRLRHVFFATFLQACLHKVATCSLLQRIAFIYVFFKKNQLHLG